MIVVNDKKVWEYLVIFCETLPKNCAYLTKKYVFFFKIKNVTIMLYRIKHIYVNVKGDIKDEKIRVVIFGILYVLGLFNSGFCRKQK